MIVVLGHLKLRPGGVARLHNTIARQVPAARAADGCLHYSMAADLLDPDCLRIAEHWRDRAAQSAHLVSDHMAQFNIGMRIATVTGGLLEAYENGMVRKILEVPAERFRPEYEDAALVLVVGTIEFAPGEIDRMRFDFVSHMAATRAEDGCQLYTFGRDPMAPDTLHVAERWRDRATFAAHSAAPHMAAFRDALARAQVERANIKAWHSEGEQVLTTR